jgi:hypothetical protein
MDFLDKSEALMDVHYSREKILFMHRSINFSMIFRDFVISFSFFLFAQKERNKEKRPHQNPTLEIACRSCPLSRVHAFAGPPPHTGTFK